MQQAKIASLHSSLGDRARLCLKKKNKIHDSKESIKQRLKINLKKKEKQQNRIKPTHPSITETTLLCLSLKELGLSDHNSCTKLVDVATHHLELQHTQQLQLYLSQRLSGISHK